MYKAILSTLCCLAAIFGCSVDVANAGVIASYEVTDYNGGTGGHGLWTQNAPKPNSFSIASGTFQILSSGASLTPSSGTLGFTAFNSGGLKAVADLTLTGWHDALTGSLLYKKESGRSYDPANQDFFSGISGDIEIFDVASSTLIDTVSIGRYVHPSATSMHTFQYGLGANAKNPNEFGGSAWVQTDASGITFDGTQGATHHWDLNLAFVSSPPPPPNGSVPEPASLALWAAMAGLVCPMRRRRR